MSSTFFFYSKYQLLNPEVIKFEILEESHEANGNWNYEVYYEEYFEHLPRIFKNCAIGNYVVSKNEVWNAIYLNLRL